MNFLFIIDSLGIGGAEILTATISEYLSKKNHNVAILCLQKTINVPICSDVYVKTIDYKKRCCFKHLSLRIKTLRAVSSLERQYGRFDLVVSSLMLSNKASKYLKREKVYYSIHSAISPSYINNRSGIRRYLKERKLKSIFDNRNLITTCPSMMQDVKKNTKIKPKSIRHIYNPINFEKIREMSLEPISDDLPDKYIVHVGRFEAMKRHDLLVEAYKHSGLECSLVLVGDGSTRPKIERLVKKHNLGEQIIFLGYRKNPFNIIRNASLLVLSSDYEGLSNVLIEALSLGTAVVSTDCLTGPSDILHKRLSRYLAHVGDHEELAEKMLLALKDDASGRYPFSDANLERFCIENVAEEYIALARG